MPSPKQLQAEWNAKLAAEGLPELEAGGRFKNISSYEGRHAFTYYDNPVKWRSREEYYRLCGEFYHHNCFKGNRSWLDRRIWALHMEGMPYPHIALKLSTKRRRVLRNSTFIAIKRMEHKMLTGRKQAADCWVEIVMTLREIKACMNQLNKLKSKVAKQRAKRDRVKW